MQLWGLLFLLCGALAHVTCTGWTDREGKAEPCGGKWSGPLSARGHRECSSLPSSLIEEFWKRETSGVSGAQSPYRMLPRFHQPSLSTCSAPWTHCTVAVRGCREGLAQSTWPTVSLSPEDSALTGCFSLSSYFLPCCSCSISCPGQVWASFPPGPEWEEIKWVISVRSSSKWPKRRVSWAWGWTL